MPALIPLGAAVIGGGASLLAAGKATGAAKDNAALTAQTAAQNAQLIRDTQAQNAGLANDQKTQNADTITAAQQANQGVFTNAADQAGQYYIGGAQGAQGALQQGYDTARGDIGGFSSLAGQSIDSALAQNTALYQPYTDAGKSATTAISALLGTGGDPAAQQQAFQNWRDSTGYKFQLQSGSDAVATNKAAQGLLRSGSALKGLDQYGQNLGSTTFQTYLGNLTGQQGVGLNATNALANLNASAGSQKSNLYANEGSQFANLATGYGQNSASLNTTLGNALAGNTTNLGGNLASNNTNAANALVSSNTGLTGSLISGNNNATNALVNNASSSTGAIAGYNQSAANTSANALTSFGNQAVGTAGYLYGTQPNALGSSYAGKPQTIPALSYANGYG